MEGRQFGITIVACLRRLTLMMEERPVTPRCSRIPGYLACFPRRQWPWPTLHIRILHIRGGAPRHVIGASARHVCSWWCELPFDLLNAQTCAVFS
jgi:hypothetical protein